MGYMHLVENNAPLFIQLTTLKAIYSDA